MKDSSLYYSVGPLLYCPASLESIARSLMNERFGRHFSLALCLEDTIADHFVAEAENRLVQAIRTLHAASAAQTFFLPKIFIRVRAPQQITSLMERFGEAGRLITGFIIPKFSPASADTYIRTILSVNEKAGRPVYMMPILESPDMIDLRTRYDFLYLIKEKLDRIEELMLNIRVGGNDLCHMFGFRRRSDESIHRIAAISSIFSDIITVFGMDYVVSGPVWEYYSGEGWDSGLRNELKEDRLCGFTGKTVIHPNQIEPVNEAYRVSQKDLSDARAILGWDNDSGSLVSANSSRERMNERKVHENWARRILMLSEVYGAEE